MQSLKANSKSLLGILKKSGYKITGPRLDILKTISSKTPLCAQEVYELLRRKSKNVDLVTIYRTLELFCDLGIVQKSVFEDKIARFELIRDEDHHHHLVCIRCGHVEEVSLDETRFVNQIETKSNFKIQRHSLEFFGFCKNCI